MKKVLAYFGPFRHTSLIETNNGETDMIDEKIVNSLIGYKRDRAERLVSELNFSGSLTTVQVGLELALANLNEAETLERVLSYGTS